MTNLPSPEDLEALTTALRDVGVYVDELQVQEGEQVLFIFNCYLGDVAFSDRVQNPVQHSIDDEFKIIAREYIKEQFEQERERIKREGL